METGSGRLPPAYDLLEVVAPEEIGIEEILTLDEAGRKANPLLTQRVGDVWLTSKETPLGRVPSAIVPRAWNHLLNPEYPDAKQARIAEVIRERSNSRLSWAGAR